MSLRHAKSLLVICVASLALLGSTAQVYADEVSVWLRQMGCEDLLAAHLEEQLSVGDSKTKISAAMELAELYALFLSRDTDGSDEQTLQKATTLLTRIPQEGVIDLRLQLLRVRYLAAERSLERYRLRLDTKEQANRVVDDLIAIASDIERLHNSLLRNSRSKTDKKLRQIGLSSSLLAWAKYYVAWHKHDSDVAKESALVFASILLSDRATLTTVSLDLRATEYGARALLGIALCKDLTGEPQGSIPWFDVIEHTSTWGSIRAQVPMWKYFLSIDHGRWGKVLEEMQTVTGADRALLLRIAAVHAMEHYDVANAQKVAKIAIANLIQMGQLAIVSEIIESYGLGALKPQSFIAKYIQGDQLFRKARKRMFGDEPLDDPVVMQEFKTISQFFFGALHATDASEFNQLSDDCYYMLGLSLFYSSSFIEAAEAFQDAAKGDDPEQAIWMAIVSLDHVDVIPQKYRDLKEHLIAQYLDSWSRTHRATQLLLLQTDFQVPSSQHIDDLLAVLRTDPQHEAAQRQASQLLYQVWRQAQPFEKAEIGNRYISAALPIMMSDSALLHDDSAIQRTAVRSFRLLEVALHADVLRLVAAEQVFSIVNAIQQAGRYSIHAQLNELTYRQILSSIYAGDATRAETLTVQLIQMHPDDEWSTLAARAIWRSWSDTHQPSSDIRYMMGMQLLRTLTDSQITSTKYLSIATATARAAFEVSKQSTENLDAIKDALNIAQIILHAYPLSRRILHLNANIEMSVGDVQLARSHWRTIAAGCEHSSYEWFEARYYIISLLAAGNPTDALAVLDQHLALYPNYGMEPFAARLQDLHKQLKVDSDGS